MKAHLVSDQLTVLIAVSLNLDLQPSKQACHPVIFAGAKEAALRLDARMVGEQHDRLVIRRIGDAEGVGFATDYYSFDLCLLPVGHDTIGGLNTRISRLTA